MGSGSGSRVRRWTGGIDGCPGANVPAPTLAERPGSTRNTSPGADAIAHPETPLASCDLGGELISVASASRQGATTFVNRRSGRGLQVRASGVAPVPAAGAPRRSATNRHDPGSRRPVVAAVKRAELARHLRRAASPLVAFLFLSLSFGCRAASSLSTDEAKPVPECQEYERAYARCTGLDASIANQPAALAKTNEDRERLAKLCQLNLERLHRACR